MIGGLRFIFTISSLALMFDRKCSQLTSLAYRSVSVDHKFTGATQGGVMNMSSNFEF